MSSTGNQFPYRYHSVIVISLILLPLMSPQRQLPFPSNSLWIPHPPTQSPVLCLPLNTLVSSAWQPLPEFCCHYHRINQYITAASLSSSIHWRLFQWIALYPLPSLSQPVSTLYVRGQHITFSYRTCTGDWRCWRCHVEREAERLQ